MALALRTDLESLLLLVEGELFASRGSGFPTRIAAFESAEADQLAVVPPRATPLSIRACRAGWLVGSAAQRVAWASSADPEASFIQVADPTKALGRILEGPAVPLDDPDDWWSESEVVGRFGRGARTALVHRSAVLGSGVRIGGGAIVHARVRVGEGSWIGDGAVIGAPGFGLRCSAGGWRRYPHWAGVEIEQEVEIGPCTQVAAGLLDATWIGGGARIDALVQVGHNVRIGRRCRVAAQTGFSGSVVLGDDCAVGGQAGFAEHVRLGDGCQVAARAGVTKSWPAGSRLAGFPAEPIGAWRRRIRSA